MKLEYRKYKTFVYYLLKIDRIVFYTRYCFPFKAHFSVLRDFLGQYQSSIRLFASEI